MTWFDILTLSVLGLSAVLAYARGFVREFLSMLALALAILAVLWAFPLARGPARGLIEIGWLADLAVIGLVFLAVYVVVRVITGRIHEWVHDSEPLGILDRAAGLVFGVARGLALLAVAALVVQAAVPPRLLPQAVREARFYPLIMLTADALKTLAPEAGRAATSLARGAAAAGEGMAARNETEPTNALDGSPDSGGDR